MKKQPVSPTRVASCCLSPAEVWRTLLTHLLAQHYGLTLSDTPFGEEDTIQAHIEAGVPMAEALNAVVEMYDLVRTDRDNAGFILGSPLITTIDVLRARKATGLLNRGTYKAVSHITQGRRSAPDAPQSLNPERRCRCCHRTRSPDRMRSVLCQRMTVSLLRMTSIPTFGWQYAMLKVSLSGGSGTLSPEPGRVLTTICNAMA